MVKMMSELMFSLNLLVVFFSLFISLTMVEGILYLDLYFTILIINHHCLFTNLTFLFLFLFIIIILFNEYFNYYFFTFNFEYSQYIYCTF